MAQKPASSDRSHSAACASAVLFQVRWFIYVTEDGPLRIRVTGPDLGHHLSGGQAWRSWTELTQYPSPPCKGRSPRRRHC